MGSAGRGQASVEWVTTSLIALALLVALGIGLRGVVDPGPALRQALVVLGVRQESPPPAPPAHLVRGAPGDPALGRVLSGAARLGTEARAGAAAGRAVRATGEVIRVVRGQAAAFARGFRGRLVEIVTGWSTPPTLRTLARKALLGLWEATPYAQLIRNAISGGRILLAGIRHRSVAAATEQAGRETADRVVGFLLGRARRHLGGRAPSPRGDRPARTRRSSGADDATRP